MVVMAPVKKPKQNLSFQKNEQQESDNEDFTEENDDAVPQDIQIIAQEVKIVKSLACNDLTKRNRQMKKLRKWLQLRTKSSFPFTQEDFMRIWKGLYYNMWYSDKPLIQEELAEQLGKLLECFEGNLQYSVNFFGAFLSTMCIEWFGLDQWRIDKFLMLARRMLRYIFKVLKAAGWSLEAIEVFNKHATETVLFENVTAKGLTMHYFDIFFEELAKVSEGEITPEQVTTLIKPFVKFMATQRDFNLISHCRTRIFYHLLYQSDLGREYSEKYNAWKDMGFPSKHIDDLEKAEESENEELGEEEAEQEQNTSAKHLDPRAGNVDVFMPELPLDAQSIIKEIEHFIYKEECVTKRRKVLKKLLELFKTYQTGRFPLGIKTMPRFEDKSEKPLIREKVRQLENLENELYGVDRKLKQMTKRKRRKFLKSLNFDEIDESNYDQSIEKALPKDYLMERRKRSQKSLMTGWLEEELNEEELKPKKSKQDKNNSIQENGVQPKNKNKQKLQTKENQEELSEEPAKKLKKLGKSLNDTKNEETPLKLNKKSKKLNESLKDNIKNSKTEETTIEKTPQLNLSFKQTKVLKLSDPEEQSTPKSNKKKEHKILKISDPEEQSTPKPQSNKQKEPKILKIADPEEQSTPKSTKKSKTTNEWDDPMAEGEIEYFLPSRKLQLKKANADFVLNPLAKNRITDNHSTPVNSKKSSLSTTNTPRTPGSLKRVKIALKHNTSQNPHEYIQQIKSSPNIPYDAKKMPGKGLLKPNAMPSPINPFYKKKIGLKLLNDTI